MAPLLEVEDLTTHFHTREGVVRAVDGVSFTLDHGETLAIVGESGSGKSVCCQSLLRLIPMPPARIERGRAVLDGAIDLLQLSERRLRKIRGKRIAMIFQDPMASLNPYLRISSQIIEPLRIHCGLSKRQAVHRAIESLEKVGIPDPSRRVHAYPHELSGGMRQRAMIAMALITDPEILIADEPTTALDVTVQAQILELIKERQRESGTAIIFITHDLGVVANISDRVAVMYAGEIVERGTVDEIFYTPLHPYTRILREVIPSIQRKGEVLATVPGAPPEPTRRLRGCPFAPRCDFSKPRCESEEYAGLHGDGDRHRTACLRVQEGSLEMWSSKL